MVALLDDQAAIRDSLAALLAASGWTVRAFATAEAFRAWAATEQAEAYVIDVKLAGGGDGLAVLEGLREAGDATPAVIITGHAEAATLRRALRAGAFEVLEKPFTAASLLTTLRRCIGSLGARGPAATPDGVLTEQERRVLAGLAAGQTQRGLARTLGVETPRIEAHRAAVLQKLGARSLFQAMRNQHAGAD